MRLPLPLGLVKLEILMAFEKNLQEEFTEKPEGVGVGEP
jgi:hypothetical protein